MKRIAVLGGGTGSFSVLSGLKNHPVNISAIVTMSDDGGGSGILRDELGVLPPGDLRQCLVALSESSAEVRTLFNYRFHEGSLNGQSAGNIVISAMEKALGDSRKAMDALHKLLNVRGRVIPVSSESSTLCAEFEGGHVVRGEHMLDQPDELPSEMSDKQIVRCFLERPVVANTDALFAIEHADLIVIGPGDVYTSLVPVLLVDGISDAIATSRAKAVFVMGLAQKGLTMGYTALRILEVIERYLLPASIDYVLTNSAMPSEEIVERYARAGERLVQDDLPSTDRIVRCPLLASTLVEPVAGDALKRTLLRHDQQKLAQAILDLLTRK